MVENEIDYFMKDFTVTAMDANGKPESRLTAETLYHYADRETAELAAPHLELYREDGSITTLVSERATFYEVSEKAWLQDEVVVKNRLTDGRVDMTLTTRDLWLDSQTEQAETEAPVEIVTKMGVTRGIGMKADMKQEKMSLLAEVRGVYEGKD